MAIKSSIHIKPCNTKSSEAHNRRTAEYTENGRLHFKAGGGITAKSRWESEYNEVIQKIYVPIY